MQNPSSQQVLTFPIYLAMLYTLQDQHNVSEIFGNLFQFRKFFS